MLQSYTLLHKTSGNENISVLNFIKSNNLKVLLSFYRLSNRKQGGHHVANRLIF